MNVSASFCGQSYNALQNNKGVILSVYNPAQGRTTFVRTKVPHGNIEVTDSNKKAISDASVICANATDTTDCDLFFKYTFDGYSLNFFYINPSSNSILVTPQPLSNGKVFDINSNQKFTINTLQTFTLTYGSGKTFEYTFEYNYYPAF